MEGYITASEAAKIIGCVHSRVRQLCRDKKLVAERIGRDWLIQKVSAEKYRDTEQGKGFPRGRSRKPKKP